MKSEYVEHFFDGYKANPEYALNCLKQAYDNDEIRVVTPMEAHYLMKLEKLLQRFQK